MLLTFLYANVAIVSLYGCVPSKWDKMKQHIDLTLNEFCDAHSLFLNSKYIRNNPVYLVFSKKYRVAMCSLISATVANRMKHLEKNGY